MCRIEPAGHAKLDGDRVFVRPMSVDDVPDLSVLLAESVHFHKNWVSYPRTELDLRAYLRSTEDEGTLLFVAGKQDSGELVGLLNLSRFAMGAWRTCECGCAVVVRHRGHGYLTEALALLVGHAMSALGMCRVEALVAPGNEPSQRMLRAIGFQVEGLARAAVGDGRQRSDQIRWAITAGDLGR